MYHPTVRDRQGQCHTRRIHWKCWGLVSSLFQPLLNNFILLWNSSYRIPKSLFSKCIMCTRFQFQWNDSHKNTERHTDHLQNVCAKKSNFHRTLLPLWSRHMCVVLPDIHLPLWRLAWNNGKLLTQAWMLNDTCILVHCDVIYGNPLGPNTSRVAHMDSKDGYQTQQVRLSHPYTAIRMISVIQVRREWQCSMDFHEQDGRDARFNGSCSAQFSVQMSRMCEFRVIMGIMTGLLGCCLWSTLGLREDAFFKSIASLWFWLHHSPGDLGCFTNNTRAASVIIPSMWHSWFR